MTETTTGMVLVPKTPTDEMIFGACAAHYGARRVKNAGGIDAVDMTANDVNWTFRKAFRRMYKGMLAARPAPPSEDEGEAVNDAAVAYVNRYGGRCRDCADEGGVCPRSGIICTDPGKAIRFVLEAVRYGVENGYLAASTVFADPALAALRAELTKTQHERLDWSHRAVAAEAALAERDAELARAVARAENAEAEREAMRGLLFDERRAIARAKEDERDRLYAAAVDGVELRRPGFVNIAGWLGGEMGAELPADRASLRSRNSTDGGAK